MMHPAVAELAARSRVLPNFYASAWTSWCELHGIDLAQVTSRHLLAFLRLHHLDRSWGAGSVALAAYGVSIAQRRAGHPDPLDSSVRDYLRAVARVHGRRTESRPIDPISADLYEAAMSAQDPARDDAQGVCELGRRRASLSAAASVMPSDVVSNEQVVTIPHLGIEVPVDAEPAAAARLRTLLGPRSSIAGGPARWWRVVSDRLPNRLSWEAVADASEKTFTEVLVAADPYLRRHGRDRAYFATGFATGHRHDELAHLRTDDCDEVPEGVVVLVRESKTDPTGKGRESLVPHLAGCGTICPACALLNWLDLLRRLDRQKRVRYAFPRIRFYQFEDGPLSLPTGSAIVKRMCGSLVVPGVDELRLGTRSLRAGCATSLAAAGYEIYEIAGLTGHVDPESLLTYIRFADPGAMQFRLKL